MASFRVMVGSVPYLPSQAVVRALEGQEHWDSEAQTWYLTVNRHELRVSPQMPVVLVDGVSRELSAPPVIEQGQLLLPERLWSETIGSWKPLVPSQGIPVTGRLRTIVVDPGHGGHDPGAHGPTGLKEKSLALDVAKRLRDLLTQDGFRVVMTRSDDRFIPLNGRTAIGNRQNGDLFVSIHANASRSKAASGFECYYLSEATDDNARALAASENATLPDEVDPGAVSGGTQAIVWDLLYTEHRVESSDLASRILYGLKTEVGPKNRGVKSARFAVLKGARMPAVLVEVGFITNRKEEQQMRNAQYRQNLAEGVRRGIHSFKEEFERKNAYTR